MEEENKVLENNEQELGLKSEDYYDLDEIKYRIEQRKRLKAEKKKKAKKRLIIGLSVFGVILICFLLSISSIFTVDSIEVRGNKYFSAEEIINMSHAVPGKNLLYKPQKGTIVKYLEDNPYISDAKVSRELPSTLVITVKERKEIAALKFDDDYLIIDSNGILLRKTRTTPKLTEVTGIVVKKIKLGEKIEVKDEELLDQTVDILNMMGQKDVYFVSLDVREMYFKAYIYDTFVCKGTYSQLLEGIEKDRLHRVLDKLLADGIKRGTITFSDEGYASFVPTL